MKLYRTWNKSLVFLLFLLGLISSASAEPLPEFKVGVLIELSGAGASIGHDCKRGVELAYQAYAPGGTVGRRSVTLVFGDSKDDARTSVNEFRKLTSVDDVKVVIVDRSKVAMPLNPISRQI